MILTAFSVRSAKRRVTMMSREAYTIRAEMESVCSMSS